MEGESSSSSPVPMLLATVGVIGVFLYFYIYGFPSFSGGGWVYGGIGIALIVGILYFAFQNPVALYLYLLLAAILLFVLYYFGYISASTVNKTLDINIYEKPTPSPAKGVVGEPQLASLPDEPQVFYIADNVFTYAEAPAVCAAYGAELATYPQIEQAYNSGGEWCGYGWSQGGLALFPTQYKTWEKLQMEGDCGTRNSCGRPGINGGYFDPTNKFGVNCYGRKPRETKGQRRAANQAMSNLARRYRDEIRKFTVAGFNAKDWYQPLLGSLPSVGTGGIQDAESGISGLGSDIQSAGSSAVSGLESGAKSVVSGVETAGGDIVTGIESIPGYITMGAKAVASGIGSLFTGTAEGVGYAAGKVTEIPGGLVTGSAALGRATEKGFKESFTPSQNQGFCPPDVNVYAPLSTTTNLALTGDQPPVTIKTNLT
jgi:hypothetical protein